MFSLENSEFIVLSSLCSKTTVTIELGFCCILRKKPYSLNFREFYFSQFSRFSKNVKFATREIQYDVAIDAVFNPIRNFKMPCYSGTGFFMS